MNFSGYDRWKTTNPDDAFLGSAPQGGNPHNYRVEAIPGGYFIIVNERGNDIGAPLYLTFDDASDAIGEMVADDEADKRLSRNRHESPPDESPQPLQCGARLWPTGRS